MDSAGETAKEGGDGATSVRNVLSGGSPGSISFWVRYLGFVGGNVREAGGGARGIPKEDNRTDGSGAELQDLAMCGSRESPLKSRNAFPRSIYQQAAGNNDGVGSIATNLGGLQ